MKAIEFLEMIVRCGVSADAMDMVTLNKWRDVKDKFDGHLTSGYWKPTPGRYAYIRTDEISDTVFGYMENAMNQLLMTDEQDMKHEEEGVPVMYMMFLMED